MLEEKLMHMNIYKGNTEASIPRFKWILLEDELLSHYDFKLEKK